MIDFAAKAAELAERRRSLAAKEYRVIIAGSRDLAGIGDVALVGYAIHQVRKQGWTVKRVVCGKARGIDTAGEQWAIANGVPHDSFHADWERAGRRAGYLRNARMAAPANSDALIAIWNGFSAGTAHMIGLMERRPSYILKVDRWWVKGSTRNGTFETLFVTVADTGLVLWNGQDLQWVGFDFEDQASKHGWRVTEAK